MHYTADSPLLAPPPDRFSLRQPYNYLVGRSDAKLRRKNGYTELDVMLILSYYTRYFPEVGLNPVLGIAQMIHETGGLTSWWSARPRRNPAGIGVTGATSDGPMPERSWAERDGVWVQGLSFRTWVEAVQNQAGRLLLYALPFTKANPIQQVYQHKALVRRDFPDHMRGSAPNLRRLGAVHNPTGNGWADPGDEYGAAIAKIANAILATPQTPAP